MKNSNIVKLRERITENEVTKEPGIFNDKNKETFEWIRGGSKEHLDVNVLFSSDDASYLAVHLFFDLFDSINDSHTEEPALFLGNKEKLRHWRLINLLIQSGGITKEDAEHIYSGASYLTCGRVFVTAFNNYIA